MNVDCAFFGISSRRGVFRDSEGRVLQFGKEIQANLVVHVELMRLRERLLVATESRCGFLLIPSCLSLTLN